MTIKMSFLLLQDKENEVILNTPNRKEILKDGPTLSQVKNNLLGRGAYGTVIKAIYKAQPVAVKVIKNLKDVNNQTMLNEAHALGWKHRNIVRILKIESTPNFAIVIMERFNGHNLQNTLDSMEIPVVHRIHIAMDILSGLMYCHKRYLLHMDVKPQNVMISFNKPTQYTGMTSRAYKSYICKLCDFGSSLKIAADEKQNVKGLVKGTLRYMAPEALKEEYLTPAADIYSLGITLWQMKNRQLPYHWLQCNEIVAYQVVKHKLRPNNNNAPQGNGNGNNANSTNTHQSILNNHEQLCLCETNSTEFSYHSLENVLKILQHTECELITESKPGVKQLTKKMPLKDLSNNSNSQNVKTLKVKRDLQCEFTSSETFALTGVLRFTPHMAVGEKSAVERHYEDIYESCWHSDFKQRPTSSQLYKQFKDLL